MPRTSKCVLEDVLEAKNVFEDSTSDLDGTKASFALRLFQLIFKAKNIFHNIICIIYVGYLIYKSIYLPRFH